MEFDVPKNCSNNKLTIEFNKCKASLFISQRQKKVHAILFQCTIEVNEIFASKVWVRYTSDIRVATLLKIVTCLRGTLLPKCITLSVGFICLASRKKGHRILFPIVQSLSEILF